MQIDPPGKSNTKNCNDHPFFLAKNGTTRPGGLMVDLVHGHLSLAPSIPRPVDLMFREDKIYPAARFK